MRFHNILYILGNHAFPGKSLNRVYREAKKVGHAIPLLLNGKSKDITRVVTFKNFAFNETVWEIRDSIESLPDRDYKENAQVFLFDGLKHRKAIPLKP